MERKSSTGSNYAFRQISRRGEDPAGQIPSTRAFTSENGENHCLFAFAGIAMPAERHYQLSVVEK